MDAWELMKARHSVRQYEEKPIEESLRAQLNQCAEECNRAGNLHIQIFYDEPECFNSRMAHYGKFENCTNYIAMVGKKAKDLDERCGYYGEKIVLKAQELGLNTCWVALTHGKSKAELSSSEKEVIIIALGYGKTQGVPHKSKDLSAVSEGADGAPEWFTRGMEAALLAPTAINQQKFKFILSGDKVVTKIPALGTNLNVDLGIVKYHFELGSGKGPEIWG